MITEIAPAGFPEDEIDAVRRSVEILRAGGVVALPTETVYGLAADAFNPEAVAKVFEAKERPSFDPLIVHLHDIAALEQVAAVPRELAKVVHALIEKLWPGPLTIILPKQPGVPDIVTGGLDTVAVRMSANSVFQNVIKEFGGPLAAPSANRFGRISPTSASAVLKELDGRIPLIVDGGGCWEGLESTIIRIEKALPKSTIHILRAGPVAKEELRDFGRVVMSNVSTPDSANIVAPGQMESHYAPRTRLRLIENPADFTPDPDKTYALLSFRGRVKDGYNRLADYKHVAVLSPGSGKLPEAAVRLFFLMRELDEAGVDEIIAEPVPERGLGVAIMERLRRAST